MKMGLMVKAGSEVVTAFHTSAITSRRIVAIRVLLIILCNSVTNSRKMMIQYTLHIAFHIRTLIS